MSVGVRGTMAALMFGLIAVMASEAQAESVQGDRNQPVLMAAAEHESLWDQTKQNAAEAWRETKHGAKKVWQGTKDVTSDAYHGAKKTVSKGVDTVEKKTK